MSNLQRTMRKMTDVFQRKEINKRKEREKYRQVYKRKFLNCDFIVCGVFLTLCSSFKIYTNTIIYFLIYVQLYTGYKINFL